MATRIQLDLERLLSLYREGKSALKIARSLGASYQTVVRRLRERGEIIRPGGSYALGRDRPKFPIDEMKLRSLRKQDLSTRAIGDILGCSEECVRDRMVSLGIERLSTAFPGDKNPQWKGGRVFDDDGYVLIYAPDHPHAVGRYVREHRLVMEKRLGRYLSPEEVVHHKNDNRGDNADENLELYATNADHLRATLQGKVPKWTEDGKRRMREGHPARRAERAANLAASKSDADPLQQSICHSQELHATDPQILSGTEQSPKSSLDLLELETSL